jgi:hypothetical protein
MQAVRQRRTSQDDSRVMSGRNAAMWPANGLRAGLCAVGALGVVSLVLATFSPVIEITVGTTTRLASLDTELSGWDRHGPALLVVAGLALVMLVGAVRGARPAMAAVVVCGLAALVVCLGFDAPALDDTGQVGELYADAVAGPGVGFWLEALGGALLCVAGGGLLVVARRSGAVGRAPRSRTAHRAEGVPGAGAPLRDADV